MRHTSGGASEAVLALARKHGILRPRDLKASGIPREYASRLWKRGLLVRHGRGLYALPESEPGAYWTFAEVARLIPGGVVCLLSALSYHRLTTQLPHEIWLAIGRSAWRSRIHGPRLRIVHFAPSLLRQGVSVHQIQGVPVRVTDPARTVADCFKYRNKIGQDVAIEALRAYWHRRGASMADLERYAKLCRVAVVMRPYLETLT